MIPSPQELGFSPKFEAWRPNQERVIQDGVESTARFTAQVQKMGAGKSLVYMAQAIMHKRRTMILTATKGLQDQLLTEFGSMGLVDIRGRSNYQCDGMPGHNCEEGSIGKCLYRGSTLCPYGHARQDMMESDLCTTNYACWMAGNKYGNSFGQIELLICDEFHAAPGLLASAMQVVISERERSEELHSAWPELRTGIDEQAAMMVWKEWASVQRSRLDEKTEDMKNRIGKSNAPGSSLVKNYQHMRNLQRKLADIAICRADTWVYDRSDFPAGYRFDPKNPSEQADRLLWAGVPKVICVSATTRPKTFDLCGVDDDDLNFLEYHPRINKAKTPLIHIPTIFGSHKNEPWELLKLVRRIDEIIASRFDRKGIIHTSNFRLRDFIVNNSEYSEYMISNYKSSGDVTSEVIQQFKDMPSPAVLVSPSISTGYDFPNDLCRYQIIAKLPYPNHHSSKVEREKTKEDPSRTAYQMMQTLTQTFGRPDRSEDDWAETFILDNHIVKAIDRYRDLAPPWLTLYYRQMNEVPPPMNGWHEAE